MDSPDYGQAREYLIEEQKRDLAHEESVRYRQAAALGLASSVLLIATGSTDNAADAYENGSAMQAGFDFATNFLYALAGAKVYAAARLATDGFVLRSHRIRQELLSDLVR